MTNNEIAVKILARRLRRIIPDWYEIVSTADKRLTKNRVEVIGDLIVRLSEGAAQALEESLAELVEKK